MHDKTILKIKFYCLAIQSKNLPEAHRFHLSNSCFFCKHFMTSKRKRKIDIFEQESCFGYFFINNVEKQITKSPNDLLGWTLQKKKKIRPLPSVWRDMSGHKLEFLSTITYIIDRGPNRLRITAGI